MCRCYLLGLVVNIMVAASLTAMEPVNNAPHSPKRRYPENDKTKKVIRVWRPKKIYEEVKVEENIHVLASDDVYCDYDGCGEPCGDIESYVAHMAAGASSNCYSRRSFI